jgi:hypothetical protein
MSTHGFLACQRGLYRVAHVAYTSAVATSLQYCTLARECVRDQAAQATVAVHASLAMVGLSSALLRVQRGHRSLE